jgi:hypothetical protein
LEIQGEQGVKRKRRTKAEIEIARAEMALEKVEKYKKA